jgi:ATP-dependent helicase/nuclease subunit A
VQLFLQWLSRNDAEIKRDSSNTQHNNIRILTTHGAKGLQAPIVFLADASAKPSLFKTQRDMLWAHDIPLWITEKNNLPIPLQQPLAHDEKATLDEYYRLLYVAMTRAEDELYVTGWAGERETQKEIADWHSVIWNHVQTHGEATDKNDPDQSSYRFAFIGDDKAAATDKAEEKLTPVSPDDLPWLWHKPPVSIDERPHPLRPSRPPHSDPGGLSPLQQDNQSRFARGLIVHKILQHLTSYPMEEQSTALRAMLSYPEFGLAEKDQITLYDELNRLITNPDTQFIFNTAGYNEVSVTGSVFYDNKEFAVIGTIDRLVFHDNVWWVIDYKTNRPPAKTPAEVPDAYLFQLASYRALIQKLYPDRTVQGALLWTFNNTVMPLPDAQLNAIIPVGN